MEKERRKGSGAETGEHNGKARDGRKDDRL
jgi:hypothetical protein